MSRKYYFYCPHCEHEDEIKFSQIPVEAVGNCRGGYGIPIHHFECSICGNLDAGCMLMEDEDAAEKRYYRKVIGMYQGIRGFNKSS